MIQMSEELERISTWLALNRLLLNLTKTYFILFIEKWIHLTNFTSKSHNIPWGTNWWTFELEGTYQRCCEQNITIYPTEAICKARHFVTRSLLKSIYYALIYLYIFYGNLYVLTTHQSHLDRIYKLQKKIVRIIIIRIKITVKNR